MKRVALTREEEKEVGKSGQPGGKEKRERRKEYGVSGRREGKGTMTGSEVQHMREEEEGAVLYVITPYLGEASSKPTSTATNTLYIPSGVALNSDRCGCHV